MRKTALIISLFLVFGCNRKAELEISNFPTIILQTGVEKSIDLTKYASNFTNVIIGNTDGVSALFSPENKTLTLIADGSKPLIILPINIEDNDINLLLMVNKMVPYTFTYKPLTDTSKIIVMGQFNDWSRTALPLYDENGDGTFERTVYIKPQRHEYKFVVDRVELIDPENPVFVSNNIGGWNSILELSEYKDEIGGRIIKEKWEKGLFTYQYKGLEELPIKELILLHNNSFVEEGNYSIDENNLISVEYMILGDGTIRIAGLDEQNRIITENITIIKDGRALNPTDHPDDWHFAVLYNIMVDRYLDGNESNTVKIETNDLHDLANWYGGDLAGIIQKLEEGYFTDLGINSLWISPVNRQPDSAHVEWIEPHEKFSGYHGYWPIAAREIDPRFGTEDELKKIVELAHSQNMKVILDFVSNHVHEDHHYFKDHSDWFGSMTLPNGELNIRNWSEETRLTSWFDDFIPSFDYPSAPEAIDQVVDDAIWWLETFDLDGFRQDAVKHVPHTFWKALTAEMKNKFPNKDLYQIGETFGSDDLIYEYVNPGELDAQYNFAIYFNVRGVFAEDNSDFSNFDDLLNQNLSTYHPVNLMGNITSSHDQLRFIGVADGQVTWGDNCYDRSFYNPPFPVQNTSSLSKLANFHTFNISIPGIPVVYYGEEIGLMGSCDPGNRRPMRFGENITEEENELLINIGKLNRLRSKYPSLALGDLEVLKADGSLLILLKSYLGEKIIVAINNGQSDQSVATDIPFGKLENLLTGEEVLINDNKFELLLPPYSHKIFQVI